VKKTILENRMKHIFCTVETPKKSNAKYNYEPESGGFVLAKYLPLGSVFPYDFGFIPGTVGEDGAPLDVIIISEQGTFPGCILKCKVIGAIKAVQQSKDGVQVENDRFLAVPEASSIFGNIHRVAQLSDTVLDELQHFFINYNKQEGKDFQPLKILSAKDACKTIEKAKSNCQPIKKIEVFIPLYDKEGNRFSDHLYQSVSKQLIKDFGGITAYIRSPAVGIWENSDGIQIKDDHVIYEIMVSEIDHSYWKQFKKKLELQFAQKELIIRQSEIGLI